MHRTSERRMLPHGLTLRPLHLLALALLAALCVAIAAPSSAVAGMAATGEPLFYPCTSCHPVASAQSGVAPKKLPNGFAGHSIVLSGHDVLGRGEDACVVCHDAADKDPGKLKLVDGTLVDITGDVSAVCYRCHSDKHEEWTAGVHGNGKAKCTSSGCHDPHSPGSIYASALTPFIGTGFEVEVLPERKAFVPLAAPGGAPPVHTPRWLQVLTVLGVLAATAAAGSLVLERSR